MTKLIIPIVLLLLVQCTNKKNKEPQPPVTQDPEPLPQNQITEADCIEFIELNLENFNWEGKKAGSDIYLMLGTKNFPRYQDAPLDEILEILDACEATIDERLGEGGSNA